jgi:cytochrome c-type biogenesis protein CcsB
MNTYSSLILSVTTFVYGFAAFLYLTSWIFKKESPGKFATWVTAVGIVGNTAGIILRWVESYQMGIGHAPLSNLYESLVFFAWVIALMYLIIEGRYKNRTIGAFSMPLAFLAMAYASLSPHVSDRIQPLLPALKSNWLIAHVVTCFIGYAAFAIAFGVSAMYLIKRDKQDSDEGWWQIAKPITLFLMAALFVRVLLIPQWLYSALLALPLTAAVYASAFLLKRLDEKFKDKLLNLFPSSAVMDELIYQLIMFGFLFLTVGIITGAVWANSAWGRYWGWDPKETWSLITWFIYATLLHAKLMRGWHGRRIAYLSLIGFAAVLFTYFGVNLLPGLHSYGAMGQ